MFEPASAGRPHILIVEDDASVLDVCQVVLKREGYTVLTATDVEGALRLLPGAPQFAVAVIDLVLPRGSSGALIEQLKNAGMNCAIVCMSGYPLEDIPWIDDLGALSHYFLPKPFTPKQLAAAVRNALGESE